MWMRKFAIRHEKIRRLLAPFWKAVVPVSYNYPHIKVVDGFEKSKLKWLVGFIPIIRNLFYKEVLTERIIEDVFVLRNIGKKKGLRILDFGCFSSTVPIALANLGYQVVGVDYFKVNYQHPNFTFYRMNLLDNKFKDGYFDVIYGISSLEHVGVRIYPDEKNITRKDIVNEFWRLLKKGGEVIITVPFGVKRKLDDQTIFDDASLSKLFKEFKVIKEEYYARKSDTEWLPIKKAEAEKLGRKYPFSAIACFICQKKL